MWQETLRPYVESGAVVAIGVVQEQHPDRARLYAQWRKLDWPVFVDSLNLLELAVVPIPIAIDASGIVRHIRINPQNVAKEFIEATYPSQTIPPGHNTARAHDPQQLRKVAENAQTSEAWRILGDACFMALLESPAGNSSVHACDPIETYNRAIALDPSDGRAQFRLGVALRRRAESEKRQPGDAQAAVEHWGLALSADPNQYIWRRRIQQYGPRLDKPYDFYSWVKTARQEIRSRGDTPAPLTEEPCGSELLSPRAATGTGPPTAASSCSSATDSLSRDRGRFVQIESTVTPARVLPGRRVRVQSTFRLDQRSKPWWNNEAADLTVCLDAPVGWVLREGKRSFPNPRGAETREVRHLEFELSTDKNAKNEVATIPAYALYYVCENKGGKCRYVRQDFDVSVRIDSNAPSIK